MIVEEEIAQKLVDLENVKNLFSYHHEGGDMVDHVEFLRLRYHDVRSTEQSLRLMVERAGGGDDERGEAETGDDEGRDEEISGVLSEPGHQ